MRRFFFLFVLLPLAIIVIALSVANRETVSLRLNPLAPEAGWSFSAPLFVILFATLAVGVLAGGIATWLRQGKWRHAARTERAKAEQLRRDAERMRERITTSTPALAGPRERDAA